MSDLMKKRVSGFIFTSVMLLVFFQYLPISAYAAEKPSEPIRMKCSTYLPPAHYMTPMWSDLCKNLTEASKGKVIVDFFPAEVLGKSTEQWDIVVEGLADIATSISAVFYPARFPLCSFVELPFFHNNIRTSNLVIRELIRKNLITSEWKEIKLLNGYNTPPAQIFSNRIINKADDFRGLRIVGGGPVWTRTWSMLGAQAVSMGWPDIYLGLERGTIDAAPGNWAASKGWKWAEVAKYPIEISIMGGFFNGIGINTKSWNKLSSDIQSAWLKVAEDITPYYTDLANRNEDIGRKAANDAGRTIVQFPLEEKSRLAKTLYPIWEEWITRNEKAGKPAKEIYKVYVEVMKREGEPVVVKIPALYKD